MRCGESAGLLPEFCTNLEAFSIQVFTRLLGLWPDDPELMHSRSQGARVEAQDRSGPVLALDAPSGFGKDFKNLVSFGLFQGSHLR